MPGFALSATDKGPKSFVVVRRWPGAVNSCPGTIGDARILSLAQARKKARDWLLLATEGVDPRKQTKVIQRPARTVREVLKAWMGSGRSAASDGIECDRTLNRILADWLDQPITAFEGDKGAVICGQILTRIAFDEKHGPMARLVHSHFSGLFKFARKCGDIRVSPMTEVERMTKAVKRGRKLNERQIGASLRANALLGGTVSQAVMWLFLTAARRGEISTLRWADIDVINRTVTFRDTKNGTDYTIPLTDAMLAALPPRGTSPYVFAGSTSGGPFNAWSRYKKRLDVVIKADLKEDIEAWRWHDIRRTCATTWGDNGVARILVSLLLNHSLSSPTDIYDRSTRLREQRKVLEWWQSHLADIKEPGAQTNIVAFKRIGSAE